MATTQKRANAAPRATVPEAQMFVADDIRQETEGKVTMVGLYADRVIVAQMLQGRPEPSDESPIVISGITIMITLIGRIGSQPVAVEYVDPSSKTPRKPAGTQTLDFEKGAAANVLVRFQPFVTAGFGIKYIVVKLGAARSEFAFEVRRGKTLPVPVASASRPAAVPKPAKKGTASVARPKKAAARSGR